MNSKLLPDRRTFLITGLLIIITCCNTCPIIFGSLTSGMVKEGTNIVVDWTEDDMFRYSTWTVMYWNSFLKSKQHEDYWLNSYEEIQDIDLHLEFNFDTMIVSGYFSGSSESAISGRYESKQVFNGEITGNINRLYSRGKWYWEWEGTAIITLQYILKQPYSDESGSHMNTRDETIQVTADFWGDNIGATTIDVLWEDEGGHEQAERKFSFSFDEDEGLVPPEWPEPVDIDIEVSGPEYISVGQDEATFELEVAGSELSSVQQVVWHFWYDEADYYYHINSVVNSEPVSLSVSSVFMEEWTLDFESSSVMVDGIEQLPMMVEVIFFSDTDQSEQLVAPVEYEFDYVDADIDPITGNLIPPRSTDTGDIDSEETSTDSSTDAPPPSTGSNPLMTPLGLAATGGTLVIAGYGISRALKGRSIDLKKGSKLERELSDIELTETDQLTLDDAKMSGTVDTGKIEVSQGEADPIDLEKGSLVQSNGAVISDGVSVSEELAQTESSLRIEGVETSDDTPVSGEISMKETELDGQVKMNIGLNLENGDFSASSNTEIDSSVQDDITQAPGSKVEHELSDIELTSETDKLALDNAELSGTIDTSKTEVSKSNLNTLELEKGTLVQPDPSKVATPDGPSMSEELAQTESSLRIEGDGAPTDTPVDDEISMKATELEGQVKMNIGLDLENGEFSASSKKNVDSSVQDDKTKKRDS